MPPNDAQQGNDDLHGTVQYQPLPSIYRAFASGATGPQAIAETVDNSIDHVRSRVEEGHDAPDCLQVTIGYWPAGEWDDDEDVIVIKDNAGGVPPDELGKFFQLGRSETPTLSIGRFGVGAKRLIAIGNEISYQSRAHESDQGWAFDVDASEFQTNTGDVDEEIYESDRYEVDMEEGSTQIVIRELKTDWETLLGSKDIGEIDDLEEIAGDGTLLDFGGFYENFLRDGIDIGSDSTIEFELKLVDPAGEHRIEPPERISFSYLPFDDLNPRKYSQIPFESIDEYTGEKETLRVDITVGLMLSSRPDNAGLTVSMNNRNVLFRDTDTDLFSSTYLGKFRHERGHGRLVCQIDIRGSSRAMPWNDLKTGLDPTMSVTKDLLSVAENALSEYRRQTYTELPDWILSAYSEDEMHAANGGEIESVDKSNSKQNNPRFNTKPGKGIRGRSARRYPERDRLKGIVRLHRDLRIFDEEQIKPYEKPAYFKYFEESYDSDRNPIDEYTPDSPTHVAGPSEDELEIPEGKQEDIYEGALQMYGSLKDNEELPIVADIKRIVAAHTDRNVRADDETDGFEEWLLPRYEEELKRKLGKSDLSVLDILDEVETTSENSSEDQQTSEPAPADVDSSEGSTEEIYTPEKQNKKSSSQRNKETDSSKKPESDDTDDQSTLPTTSQSEREVETAGASTSTTQSEESATTDRQRNKGLTIRVPEENREKIISSLGLSEDADEEVIQKRVLAFLSGELPDDSKIELGGENGPLLIAGLDQDEKEELYRVLEIDSDASPTEAGEQLIDIIERFQRIRSMIS